MNKTGTLNIRVNDETKKQAQQILSSLNISLSEAVGVFLKQVVLTKGIPFEIKLPNKTTLKAIEDTEKGIGLHKVSSKKQLYKELGWE